MGVSVDEVKALAAKQAAHSRGRSTLVNGRNRAVVVEYKRPAPSPVHDRAARSALSRASTGRGTAKSSRRLSLFARRR